MIQLAAITWSFIAVIMLIEIAGKFLEALEPNFSGYDELKRIYRERYARQYANRNSNRQPVRPTNDEEYCTGCPDCIEGVLLTDIPQHKPRRAVINLRNRRREIRSTLRDVA